jgi:D-alanyl-D-alanine carboxypeptidase
MVTNGTRLYPITRRRIVQASALGVVTTLTRGIPTSARAQTATPVLDSDDGQPFPLVVQLALHESVARRLAEADAPGALVGIWYPGQGVWTHAAGIGNLETAAPVTLDDHVRIASNTKTIVATVVLQLVDEGLISLDDTLEEYVPGVPNGDQITIRQVLGMDAGIADYIAVREIAQEYVVDPMLDFGPDQILEVIRESTPDYAPGERVQYSNSNYILLGFLIEAVTGQSPATEVQRRVFDPLGMTSSSFPLTAWMPEPAMHGYSAAALGDPLVDVTRSNPDLPWTAGAVISTLADVRTWVVALAEGTLLTPETQAARLQTRSLTEHPLIVGYGLGVLTMNGMIGHNGGIAGYSSWMLYDPETAATIIVVVNRSGEKGGTADPILHDILTLLFPERFAALLPSQEATPASS